MFIDDIGDNMDSSMKLFADDCLLCRKIVSKEDTTKFQKDSTTLHCRSNCCQMNVSAKKCYTLRIHGKKMEMERKEKKVKLINHDCLPNLMLLYIMLAYLMLLAALSNAVCLHNAFIIIIIYFISLPLISANAFRLHALSWFIDT